MLNAQTRFTFHNVGQGLFYTGEISFNNKNENKFLLVYDCGSENRKYITRAIKCFSGESLKEEIDMLVISHFHRDHVSGLEYLLKKFNVKTVIIPYFHPLLRLLIAILNQGQPSSYYEFLANPVLYLINREVEKVILIVGDEPDENNPNDENLPRLPDNLENTNAENLLKINLERIKNGIENEIKNDIGMENLGDKFRIYSHKGYIMLIGLWLFKFFNYKFDNMQLLQDLEDCLKKKIPNFSLNNIAQIIRNMNKYKKNIKCCYEQIKKNYNLKNFNNTSLVMMHTPINHSYIRHFIYYLNYYIRLFDVDELFYKFKKIWSKLHDCEHKYFAQSLTGDIDLNFDYRSFRTHFNYFRDKLIINQIPHHGAYRNWKEDFQKNFNIPIHIASVGKRNRYGHPSKKVFENIIKNNVIPLIVNEDIWFTIEAEIRWGR